MRLSLHMETSPERWSWSDKLAVALACAGAAIALILFLAEKTPLTVGVMVAGIAALLIYPIIHFAPSWKTRIPVLIVMLALVGIFGWRSWPKIEAPSQPASIPAPTIDQTATDSECSNLVAGSAAQIKCESEKKSHAKDKSTH